MSSSRDVVVVGAGLAGLSAAIYLGRARRDTLVIHSGKSMAVWEPDVQNYLGFPDGISGEELLRRGREQAERFNVDFVEDEILEAKGECDHFIIQGKNNYVARRLLLATGLYHLPPEIPGIRACLGKSMFFCKDCDGYRVQNKMVAVVGTTNEAVEYALGMLSYTPKVTLLTNGANPMWDAQHAEWISRYKIPILLGKIERVEHDCGAISSFVFQGGATLRLNVLFTVRGDVIHNDLAKSLGLALDKEGQIVVDLEMKTSLRGVYAAGCVTPANCQMIIAAGQGGAAAQAINRDLFEQSLEDNRLELVREQQIKEEPVLPEFA